MVDIRITYETLFDLLRREKNREELQPLDKARTGSDVIDASALLPSERDYFDEQVKLFAKYKEQVLDSIIEVREFDDKSKLVPKDEPVIEAKPVMPVRDEKEAEGKVAVEEQTEEPNSSAPAAQTDFATASELAQSVDEIAEIKKVKILISLPEFVGRDGAVLGPFEEGEEVKLDPLIAELLIKRGSAEPC